MENKRFIEPEYTEEQKAFIRKYGERLLDSWERMNESQKQEYQKIENYYSIFANLLSEHYEDLKLYALMYRNVALYNCDKDPISVLYFASKQNEIIGFKKKLQADKESDKARIAFLYYDNVALFPKAVEKYTGINIRPIQPTIQTIYRSILKDLNAGNINHIFSISDLRDIDSLNILANKDNLKNDYFFLCNTCDENFKSTYNFADEDDFIDKYFIPYVLENNGSFHFKRILHFLQIKYSKRFTEEIVHLSRYYKDYNTCVTESSKLSSHIRIAEIRFNSAICIGDYECSYSAFLAAIKKGSYTYLNENERKRLETDLEKYIEFEILKEELERIDSQKKNAFDTLMSQIKTSEMFNIVYSNYNDIEDYISTSYERLYNIFWLRKPNYMRDLESHITGAQSIRNIFDFGYKKLKHSKIFIYRKNKKTNNENFIFNPIGIMKQWCEVTDKEYDEAQRIKREQERIQEEKRRREEEARRAKFEYNKRNKHYRDSNISFDEATHLYKVDGVTLQSVTNFVEGCFPKFDAEFFAKKKAAYLGKTTQEVLDMWEQKGKESRELGTELHRKIENYYQDIASSEDDTFKLFLMFANKVELKPYRTEWAVYDEKYNIAGTIDFVDYQNGEYIIYDWKRSDKIIDNGIPIKISKYDEKGNHPLEHLDNTPYYHYALQLSIYKFILENNYNMKISDLRLGIFHPTYNKPYVLRIPYLEKEINDIFGLRSEVLF